MEAQDYLRAWLENAERRRVPGRVVDEIARRYDVTAQSFRVLKNMAELNDPDGKSFFLLPRGTGGDDARDAVLMTYILNAGTDYAAAGKQPADFPPTPYSAAEVARIINRQNANSWSYRRDVRFVDRNGGRLVTTPNGMLMGLGGNWLQRQFSRWGGTAWGDIFMFNMGSLPDPAGQLRRIVESGRSWRRHGRATPSQGNLDLDRILHHEERHSRQWAANGYAGMLANYGRELLRESAFGATNRFEEDAGLSDGGYRS